MSTETFLQRELAGESPVIEPALPTDSNSGKEKDDTKLRNREAKELRLLNDNNEIVPFNKNKELAETFDTKTTVRRKINEQLGNWGLKYIPVQISPRKAA